ncbi:MAG: TetR/AcrR family transcriptional regulator [Sandaracinaceae bacterium]
MRYRKSAVSAAQIVAAATRVIARQGYAQSSLNDIAREAGMSKGAVHYHFPTKEVLVAKVLETACAAVTERTMQTWRRQEADPFEALRASIRELWDVRVQRTEEAMVVADLLSHALHDEALRPPLAAYYRFAAAQTAQHLVHMASTYRLRPKVGAELIPRLLLGLLDGLMMQAYVEPGVIDPDELVAAVEQIAAGLFEAAPPDAEPLGGGSTR